MHMEPRLGARLAERRPVQTFRAKERHTMTDLRRETDSLGEVLVAADRLWGAQTWRSLEHFGIDRVVNPIRMVRPHVATAS
jgi:hypothetical protein